ncbi:MAG: hypothetical protein RI580_16020 [Halothece sp. Uz-M2-17]|nr:hypothetical protein [Halothece sp. Uz-M2-17]
MTGVSPSFGLMLATAEHSPLAPFSINSYLLASILTILTRTTVAVEPNESVAISTRLV